MSSHMPSETVFELCSSSDLNGARKLDLWSMTGCYIDAKDASNWLLIEPSACAEIFHPVYNHQVKPIYPNTGIYLLPLVLSLQEQDSTPSRFNLPTTFCCSEVWNISKTYLYYRSDGQGKCTAHWGPHSAVQHGPHTASQTNLFLGTYHRYYRYMKVGRFPLSFQWRSWKEKVEGGNHEEHDFSWWIRQTNSDSDVRIQRLNRVSGFTWHTLRYEAAYGRLRLAPLPDLGR